MSEPQHKIAEAPEVLTAVEKVLSPADDLAARIETREATVAVIGLGYVGLPLVTAFVRAGFRSIGLDVDEKKIQSLNEGKSYIRHIPEAEIEASRTSGLFEATSDFACLEKADCILVCVPTPLGPHREPDLKYVEGTTHAIAPHLKAGQLLVLESTTYPGTTSEVVRPILESTGLESGADFFLAYAPEREDPGNADFSASNIPKIVGADEPAALQAVTALYGGIMPNVVPVSSTRVAEAVKLTENIFRSVNIALVNELKVIFERMGIDIWEVIDAAKTKPFGFMAFYPGPGLGGHCIPIDPFYLTWKAHEFGTHTRFIELAGEINNSMPVYVVQRLAAALNDRFARGLRHARILLLGIAYKKNVDDLRESPSLKLIEMIEAQGAQVDYYDAFCPEIPETREHAGLAGRRSIAWAPERFLDYDAALVATDHEGVDYGELVRYCRLVVDTRNATKDVLVGRERIVKA